MLHEALAESPFVVLQAPLGAGKSTAIAAAMQGRHDVALFDAQPWHAHAFVEDLVLAVRSVREDFGRRTLGAIESQADIGSLAELFLADLKHVPGSLTIVIDNSEQFADDADFAKFFETLVNGMASSVRVLLSGRSLPPSARTSLLLQKHGAIVHPAFLAFTADEIAQISSGDPEQILRDTQGWAAGVSLSASHDAAIRFLSETLIAKLDTPTLEFLESASVYEHYDENAIANLARAGAPITVDQHVLRLHPLLRDAALERLQSSGRAPSVHVEAARAYMRKGNIAAALFHMRSSEDASAIDAFVREHAESLARIANQSAVRETLALLTAHSSRDIRAYMNALLERYSGSDEVDRLLNEAVGSSDERIAFSARAALAERSIGRTGQTDSSLLADIADRSTRLDESAKVRVAMLHGWSCAVKHDFAGALAAVAPLIKIAEPTARFNAVILYAYAQTARGEGDRALAELDELVTSLENDDRVVLQALSLIWQTRLALLLGRATVAAESGRAALRLIDLLPMRAEQAALYVALAETAANDGNAAETLEFGASARAFATHAWYSADVARGAAIAEIALALATFLSGDAATAIQLAERAGAERNFPSTLRALAYAESAMYAGLTNIERARALAECACDEIEAAQVLDAADATALATAIDLVTFLDEVAGWKIAIPKTPMLQPFDALLNERRGLITPLHLAVARQNVGTFESSLSQMARNGDRFDIALMRRYGKTGDATRRQPAEDFDLTARETEILTLLVEGLANKEIAQRLVLSPRTVETHVERVLGKLEVGSRSRAIAKALRLGLVTLPAD